MKNCIYPGRLARLSVLACASFSLHAQTTLQLSDTVVTATRLAQPAAEVVADISSIERAEIERSGATTVTQLLAHLPGLQVSGQGDSGRVYARGAEARMTALYIDGVRVDSQDGLMLGGGAPWDLVPVAQIERIEVLRGPASAVYGSAAMGGVVQIFTRRGQGAFAPYVNLGLGSFHAQQVGAGFSGAQGGWTYALGLGYDTSDGFNTRPDLEHTPDHEPLRQRSASLRLGYQMAASQQVEVSALNSWHDSRYVPWGGGTDYTARADLSTSVLNWRSQWIDDFRTSVTASFARVAKRDDAPNDFFTTTQSLLWDNQLCVAGGTATATLEQRRDSFEAQATAWDPRFRGERSQDAVALGYGATHGLHALQVNVRNDQDSRFGAHLTGVAAYAYSFAPHWRASVSTGTAFRAPTLEQVAGPYGSAQLQPETNRSSELGLRYASAATSFKAVAYRNQISDMISSSATLDTCSAGYFCYYNVGQASIAGLTLSGRHQYQRFEVYASADVLDPKDDRTGHVLSLRARRLATLGFEANTAGWLWGAQWRKVGERFDNAANTQALAGYDVVNLSASRALATDWHLVLRVDNATDQSYQEVGSLATPGRTLYAGLRWQAH